MHHWVLFMKQELVLMLSLSLSPSLHFSLSFSPVYFYEGRNYSSKKLCNMPKLTLLVSGWAGIWVQVSLSLESTRRHIRDPMPLHSSLANVPQRNLPAFWIKKNPNDCPTPTCDPGLPSANSPRREAPPGPFGSLENIQLRSHLHRLPRSSHACCVLDQ